MSKIRIELFRVKLKSKTYGEIELRRLSIGDISYYEDELKKEKKDKNFVFRFLHHQIEKQEISYQDFSSTPEKEIIEIAKKFANYDPELKKSIDKISDENFFYDFRVLIQDYFKKRLQKWNEIQASLKPLSEKIAEQMRGIQKALKPVGLLESLQKQILIPFSNEKLGINTGINSLISQFTQRTNFLKAFTDQLDSWRKWADANRSIFQGYQNYWKRFQKEYDIAKKEALDILKKYKWFITLNLPTAFVFEVVKIGKKKGNQRANINRLFIDYFINNNCERLDKLVNNWGGNKIFRPRMKIFKDSILTLKRSDKKVNISTVVLPVLIAQIDGIQQDFMRDNGLSFDKASRQWKDSSGNIIYKEQWLRSFTSNIDLLDLANDIFLNILFQKSQPGEPLKTPFTFNRHKIMHGENLRYGRLDNTIRAFLILDFLSILSK